MITLRGSSVTRRIDGGSGRDVIRLLSGSVAVESTLEEDGVFGGSDSDEITLSGSVVRSIVADGAGDDGDDTVFSIRWDGVVERFVGFGRRRRDHVGDGSCCGRLGSRRG